MLVHFREWTNMGASEREGGMLVKREREKGKERERDGGMFVILRKREREKGSE